MFAKKDLSEADIRSQYILPAITKAGWDLDTQIREELPIHAGRVIVRGRKVERDTILEADYVLFWTGEHPLAVVEAKEHHIQHVDRILGVLLAMTAAG